MAVYVDGLRDWGWRLGPSCHLITDGTNEELHAFAAQLGLNREWFQTGNNPHYDLVASKRQLAVRLGAIELDDRDFAAILKTWRDAAIARLKAASTEEERQAIRAELFK